MEEQPKRKNIRIKEYDYAAPTISTVVGHLKRWVSMQIGRSIWQKSFYEHGIRNQKDYDEVWEYIDNNPLRYIQKRTP